MVNTRHAPPQSTTSLSYKARCTELDSPLLSATEYNELQQTCCPEGLDSVRCNRYARIRGII
jgi:hypothetical protein